MCLIVTNENNLMICGALTTMEWLVICCAVCVCVCVCVCVSSPAAGVCKPTKHSSWRPRHHMLAVVQLPDVLTHIGASDAGMTLDVHVVSQSQQHLHTKGTNSQSEHRTFPHSSQMFG